MNPVAQADCPIPGCDEQVNDALGDNRCDFHSANPDKDHNRLSEEIHRLSTSGTGTITLIEWMVFQELSLDPLRNVHFVNCKFRRRVRFGDVSFCHLIGCEFALGLEISGSLIGSSIRGTTVRDLVFRDAHFVQRPSRFVNLTVDGPALFNYCTFDLAPVLRDLAFHGKCVFLETSFPRPITFDRVEFGPESGFTRTDLSQVTFRKCRLHEVVFTEAYGLSNAEFDRNEWFEPHAAANAVRTRSIPEERLAITRNNILWYRAAERVYRELRRSLESHRHFAEASWMATRELEMRRLGIGAEHNSSDIVAWLRKWVLSPEAVYFHASRYGDSIGWPLAWLVALIAISPLVFAALGINLGQGWFQFGLDNWAISLVSYFALLAYCIRAAALLADPTTVSLTPAAQIYSVFLRLVAPLLAIALSLAIRRRFRR